MLWALLSILSGLGDAIAFASIKKLGNLNAPFILIFRHLVALPFLLFAFFFYSVPKVSSYFYVVVIINVISLLIAMFLMIKSLQISDLSVSIPMLNFTPLFLIFVSYILLKEVPSFIGIIGIFIIVVGSYVLNIPSIKYGYFEPFKSIFKNKGVFYMFVVAFLFSITASFTKIGVQLSNPAYFMLINYLFASIILTILFCNMFKNSIASIKKSFKHIIILGISTAFMEIMVAIALKLAIVPYVISLKRTSAIFSVLIGFIFFKEKNFKEAFIGTIIMFIGAVLIMIS